MLSGYVCLIGAGPGDTGLMTRRGLGYLKRADVVLYDDLIPGQLLLETRPDCEWIAVGKRCGKKLSAAQEDINRLLIEEAQAGKFVVRLKGGDPFLFGRGGEEAQALVQAGIPYILVPGISSSLSVPAYAGIPVTHRGVAHGVTIRTGHCGDPDTEERLPTQVVLMSLTTLDEVANGLLAEGYSQSTPAAVVSRGTTPFQQVISGTLQNIALLAKEADLPAPALLVVGKVAALADVLNWKQNLPLNGKRILWTRPETTDDALHLEDLELLGAEVERLPVFTIQPQPGIIEMLPEIAGYSWMVFTSQNAVQIFFEAMLASGKDWSYFAASKIAVVGAKTAAALKQRGRNPDGIAPGGDSQSLLELLRQVVSPGDRVALCQAEKTLPHLADGLSEAGVEYHRFILYRMEVSHYPADFVQSFFSNPFDAVVFTAPSVVINYFSLLEAHGMKPDTATRYACLGAETAAQLARVGYPAWLIPEQPRLENLIRDLSEHLRSEPHVSNHPSA